MLRPFPIEVNYTLRHPTHIPTLLCVEHLGPCRCLGCISGPEFLLSEDVLDKFVIRLWGM